MKVSESDQTSGEASADPTQIEQGVALLEVVYHANGLLAAELDRLASSRASVSDASVTGLLGLAEDLRPGAAARSQLAAFDAEVQVAGAEEWIARRRRVNPDVELLPTPRLAAGAERTEQMRVAARPVSAINRAHTRWHGQAGPR